MESTDEGKVPMSPAPPGGGNNVIAPPIMLKVGRHSTWSSPRTSCPITLSSRDTPRRLRTRARHCTYIDVGAWC